MARTTERDTVRELQRTLYRAAKAQPKRKFHALYDKVYRRDVLERAWSQVRQNRGAAGVDQQTLRDVEEYGVDRFLEEVAADLRTGRYRPTPGRRVWIPKAGTKEKRPLSIPSVRDRVVQAAVKIVIEPIFEADFLPCSFGFRPKRAAHDALQVIVDEAFRGRRWVVETDIASCFEEIPHDGLIEAVAERICDRHVLKLLRSMLRAGVMEEGRLERREAGTPQGGVISPLLANVYLHRLDAYWSREGNGRLCRYADDLVVMCRTRAQAMQARRQMEEALGALGLRMKEAKTRVIPLKEQGEGFDFLGFHHRWVRARGPRFRHVTFLARWPSRKAMQSARATIRELTARSRLVHPTQEVVNDINDFLRGWAGYFRYGNSKEAFDRIRRYAMECLARFVAKRHRRTTRFGWWMAAYASPDQYGLLNLDGWVIAPRPNRPWRDPRECRR